MVAERVGMNIYTFRNKLSPKSTKWQFTLEEDRRIRNVIVKMANEIIKEVAV